MKKRTISIIGVLALAMWCITGFTHAGVSEGFAAKANIVSVQDTQTEEKEITKDIYVDITAHQMYYNAFFTQQVEEGKMEAQEMAGELVKKMDEIYEAHEVTEEAYTEYHEEILADSETYLSLMGPINERVKELAEENQPE